MRQIELKTVTEKVIDPRTGQQTDSAFSYRDNILNALRFPMPNQQGIDFAEMATVIPLIQRLQKAKEGQGVTFEDAEWQIIVARVKALRWMVAGETAFDFVSYVADRPEVPAKAAAAKAK